MSIIIPKEINEAVPEAYLPFSAYVIQTRALPDARDCLKTGGRYILWSQYFNKNTFDKNRKKGADIVGPVMHWNPHGDAGIWGNIVRFAKPFSMRYLLEDAKGNVGTMTAGDDHAAQRYLELRSSELASEFTKLIKKDTIDEWKLNFTGEDKYPAVFPTLFPNFVNGNTGIGVGCVSSIPCFNLKEAIKSLKILVNNPDADYEDIYIAPDFPTGATIINADEVKESLKTGRGSAIKMRAVLEYNGEDNSIEIQEVPYQVFTNRIMSEIEKGIEEGRILGIKNYFDGTDKSCGKYGTKIVIYLNKGVNVPKLCRTLYKETSLQSSFTICQLMLENGVKPREYGLKDMMLAYLNHAMECLKKSYIFDYKKINAAIHINEGLLIAMANIDEVVEYIKKSNNEEEVINIFKEKYGLSVEQTKAILNLKLQKLMKLEAIKIEKELEKQRIEADKLNILINNKEEFNKSFIAELDRISNKYGDDRRTKILNLQMDNKEDPEPIEKKELIIYYTNLGNIYTVESSTLMKSRRGTKGKKIKLADNEVITKIISDNNFSDLYAFTASGSMCTVSLDELPLDTKVNLSQLLNLEIGDKVTTLVSLASRQKKKNFVFITKRGMIKKSETSLYNIKRGKTMKAIKLKEGDEVVNVMLMDEGEVGILSSSGCFVRISIDDITPIGKIAMGVKAIALKEGEYVIDAKEIKSSDKYLITLSKNGIVKKTSIEDFAVTNRATRGKQVSGVRDNDTITKILTIEKDCDIIIIVNKRSIKISTSEIPELSRTATGVKGINLTSGEMALDVVVSSEE